ncbi:MAG TPA: carboxyl transferase domain-containing protein [Actinomycetota bacterium]|nr:carboxyl transferase domain-containing protein [Actinomycetota bacterium]
MDTSHATDHGIADPGSFQPVADDLSSRDPLGYPDYRETLQRAAAHAGADEAVLAGKATIGGFEVELAVFQFAFLGGSMGEVAGERLARSLERAAERKVPFVLRTATGGARMQEGMRSLIQMPKVVAARLTLEEAHQPFIAFLGHPTTGGVLASLASLADITFAQVDATIGFAGPRVAERVTGRPLDPRSHTASFAFDNGMVDDVLPADGAQVAIAEVLECLAPDEPVRAESPDSALRPADGDPWRAVQRARVSTGVDHDLWEPSRDGGLSHPLIDHHVELNGDRAGAEAGDLPTWLARVAGRRVLLIQTGGGPVWPSGYRKAIRCVDIATRLGIPIVTFVEMTGADPSAESEAEGIAHLIARLTEKMLKAPVPILSVITGEGGSGGALAFATADVLLATEDSIFSVIGPEAAAEILWKDASRAPEAARLLKLTAHDLLDLGIADQVIPRGVESLKRAVTYHLGRLSERHDPGQAPALRRARWRNTW